MEDHGRCLTGFHMFPSSWIVSQQERNQAILFRKYMFLTVTETAVWRCLIEQLFLPISQNSQENTCDEFIFSQIARIACKRISKGFHHNSILLNFAEIYRAAFLRIIVRLRKISNF